MRIWRKCIVCLRKSCLLEEKLVFTSSRQSRQTPRWTLIHWGLYTLRLMSYLRKEKQWKQSWSLLLQKTSKEKKSKDNLKAFNKQSPDVFCKKSVPRNIAKFTGKYLCQRLFLIKLQALFYRTTQDDRFWQSGNFLDLFQISHYLEKSQNHWSSF